MAIFKGIWQPFTHYDVDDLVMATQGRLEPLFSCIEAHFSGRTFDFTKWNADWVQTSTPPASVVDRPWVELVTYTNSPMKFNVRTFSYIADADLASWQVSAWAVGYLGSHPHGTINAQIRSNVDIWINYVNTTMVSLDEVNTPKWNAQAGAPTIVQYVPAFLWYDIQYEGASDLSGSSSGITYFSDDHTIAVLDSAPGYLEPVDPWAALSVQVQGTTVSP